MPSNIAFSRPQDGSRLKPYYYSTITTVKGAHTKNDHFHHFSGCRKWGCNKWGLKGRLLSLPGNRPKSVFFARFLPFWPFPQDPNDTWKIQKTDQKGLFPQISSDLLKPPSLKPPFAALQISPHFFACFFWRNAGWGLL